MQQAQKRGKKNKIGAQGEEIAQTFLMERGFMPIERNYLKKWGEIDLILQKEATVHFVEVKTVSYETKASLLNSYTNAHRPEEQFTKHKYKKLARTIDTWLTENDYQGSYQLDLITVRLVSREKYAEVQYFTAVHLE